MCRSRAATSPAVVEPELGPCMSGRLAAQHLVQFLLRSFRPALPLRNANRHPARVHLDWHQGIAAGLRHQCRMRRLRQEGRQDCQDLSGDLSADRRGELPAGEKVYAIGSPKGLEASLSEGIISGKREIAKGAWWLQTTTPVSPGSSGGPLLDSRGRVVGLVVAQSHEGQNLNFAVPASQIRDFLKRQGNPRPLWRGTGILTEEWEAYLGLAVRSVERHDKTALRLLDAHKQIVNGKYDDALHDMKGIVASDFGENEYLFSYTIGRAAMCRGGEQLKRWLAQSKRATAETVREYFRDNKDHWLAKKSFSHSIELNPHFSPAYLRLAECLQEEGRLAEAFRVADRLVKMVPQCPTAYKVRGGIVSDSDQHVKALADFETAAELGPSDPETNWNIGEECSSLREDAKAVEAYERAIRLKCRNAGACHYSIGVCLKRMGKYEQAMARFQEAKRLGSCPRRCDEEMLDCQRRLE
jgi:hypothetical protein